MYKKIKVEYGIDKVLEIDNPTSYPLIGQGGMGGIFKIDHSRCIKVFADASMAKQEQEAYNRTKGSPVMPMVYEMGAKYIIMEYIDGPDMRQHLLDRGKMTKAIAYELVKMFDEMKRLSFLRRDESLRHILLKEGKQLKIIDHFYAFTLHNPYPVKMFRQLEEISMLVPFLNHVSRISPLLYEEFRLGLPEYFKGNNHNGGQT